MSSSSERLSGVRVAGAPPLSKMPSGVEITDTGVRGVTSERLSEVEMSGATWCAVTSTVATSSGVESVTFSGAVIVDAATSRKFDVAGTKGASSAAAVDSTGPTEEA